MPFKEESNLNQKLLDLSDANKKRSLEERTQRSIKQIITIRIGEEAEKDKASEELIGDHYKLIIQHANSFLSGTEGLKNELYDMIQQGIMGLLKAARSYDVDSGYAFNTYAVNFIKGAMNEYFNSCSNTKQHYATLIVKLNRGISLLAEQGIQNPTISQLARVTAMKPEQIQRAIAAKRARLTRSIDFENGTENDEDLDRAIYDSDNNPEYQCLKREREEIIRKALEALPELEQKVMEYTCGYRCEKKKYAEIASTLGISVNEVKRLMANARRHLREDANMRGVFYDQNAYIHNKIEETSMDTWT